MHELPGAVSTSHQVVAAAGDELSRTRKSEQVEADGVVVLEAGEKPTVEVVRGQRRLNFRNPLTEHCGLLVDRGWYQTTRDLQGPQLSLRRGSLQAGR